MMKRTMRKMSKEEKLKMMDKMMDEFFASMTAEEKKEMMKQMMPKMMEKMFEGMSGEDKRELMSSMMPTMMSSMMPMMKEMMGGEGEPKKGEQMMPMPRALNHGRCARCVKSAKENSAKRRFGNDEANHNKVTAFHH